MIKVIPLLLILLLVFSCKKDEDQPQEYGSYILRLTDSPGEYEHVYIDIQDVAVNVSGQGWIDIGPQVPGIYDLLNYNNGIDTLLSSATLPEGTITQIRLILGSNNSIVVSGTNYNLIVPAAQQSGIKLNVQTTISSSLDVIEWIDFDAGKSIVDQGNNVYKLLPVLRSYTNASNGRIKGTLLPVDALGYIRAIQGTDTLLAIPESSGFFQFSGLSGTYQLDFIPTNVSYSQQTTYNNSVTGSQILDIGIITLQ
ncbi:MAG: DUF4382 domain-containing protein [Flavobacteriia bacterium]|nr:DUF4382 domain-containing protein [Flavobacteriia bacterium]